ncbi:MULTISPECIES: TetR/AcrR family transcriptional regulator [Bacteroidales]|jgi:AcrR family transcriptional regulator|nr:MULTISPECIES: TetR/AcrR family transcriptional regulator [Bacteroidales]MCX4379360.1 TetR/AcrR family transcriptional regulator [Lachnospiraceae bacterium]ROS82090.1 TetR/AcrR family transcriptional regulator [Muribaculaceae bacterium Isolate-042 (Harlan)]ROS83306.1 TetR/AcrR family transcriptional regulator [Muribaculaceae bacterium Isolate-036 (Harlan)]ROS88707.1 TetR/AcrR family transcriptional regulator [Muribaculaceae bacterium Isolate-080 (Janvier)]ROS94905.1 TetR/AcrR family transcri
MYKNNRREQLYKAAFRLFLTRQYDSVSISDIEKEANMTRGAITYYAGSKLNLFHEVVKHYLVDKQDLKHKITSPSFESLLDFINKYVDGCQHTMTGICSIMSEMPVCNVSRYYISLILEISSYFPDLHERYLENRNKELAIWIAQISKAIENNEIKNDIDIVNTAKHFICIFYGQAYLDSLSMGLNTVELRNQMISLYKLLKL